MADPCRTTPSDQELEELYTRLEQPDPILSELERQKADAIRKATPIRSLKDVVERVRSYTADSPFLSNLTSQSFYLEKTAEGREYLNISDQALRQSIKWAGEATSKFYGTPTKGGMFRRGGALDLGGTPGEKASIEAMVIREHPELAGQFGPESRKVAEIGGKFFDWAFEQFGQKRPDKKIGYIPNYVMHMFDRRLLRKMLDTRKLQLQSDTTQTGAARLAQVETALEKLKSNQGLLYNEIPHELRAGFLETRTGAEGYQLDMAKMVDVYISQASRKMFLEPIIKPAMELIDKLPEGHKSIAREHLRQLLGVKDNVSDSSGRVLSAVREYQFFRTIGFNPLTAAKNAFQSTFTMAELGPKHFYRGVEAAFTPEGKAIFEGSGHIADIPGLHLQQRHGFVPWYKRAVEASSWMFQTVEQGNRKIAYLGALDSWFARNGQKLGVTFEQALQKGYDFLPQEARFYADEIVRKTQFRYGKADLPFLLRQPLVGTALQFSSFAIKGAELMWKWAAREGIQGQKKLLSLLAAGMGVSTIGGLIGFPTLGDGLASPVDFTEMWALMGAMTEGDWAKAKAALVNLPADEAFVPNFGPALTAGIEAGSLIGRIQEGENVQAAIKRFGLQHLSPNVPITRLIRSSEQLEAGGSVRDFVQTAVGLPTGDAIVRSQALRLAEMGRTDTLRDLLRGYADARGGNLPVNFLNQKAIATRRAEYKAKTTETRKATARETTFEKNRRRLRGRVEVLLRNPIIPIDAMGSF